MADPLYTVGPWPVRLADYHRDRTAESHSTLEVFLASVPLYYGRFVSGTMTAPAPSPAMAVGSALHVLLLEPARFDEVVAVAPEVDRRTRAGKETWEKFLAAAGNAEVVLPAADLARVRAMASAAVANPAAAALLAPAAAAAAHNEYAVRWPDPETGVWLKACFDRLRRQDGDPERGVIVDLKSAADPCPAAWVRQAFRLGYHRQAALYVDGAAYALGLDADHFHLVVGSEPPFESVVYRMDDLALNLGRRQNRRLLMDLTECRAFDCWDSAYAGRVVPVTPPPWAADD